MAVAFLIEEEVNRRVWRRQRVFRDRLHPFDIYDDTDLISRYRMPRHVLMEVIDLIRDRVEHPTNRSHAIPAVLQVLCAMRYYATGSFQLVTGDLGNISQPSVSRIIRRVSSALHGVSARIIRFPLDQAGQNMLKEGFYHDNRRIPNVLGCVDGSLVAIRRPSENEAAYTCRHHYPAINVQGVCSEDKKFLNIVANWPGATHDAFIWRQCNLNQQLANGAGNDGYLLGDSAYPLMPWLLTPVRNPENRAERMYNSHHRRMRQRIEGTFSRWKMRWQCLHREGKLCFPTPLKALMPTNTVKGVNIKRICDNSIAFLFHRWKPYTPSW